MKADPPVSAVWKLTEMDPGLPFILFYSVCNSADEMVVLPAFKAGLFSSPKHSGNTLIDIQRCVSMGFQIVKLCFSCLSSHQLPNEAPMFRESIGTS